MKIFFSPIRAIWRLVDSLWHPEPKNKWFLLCKHDVRRVHEKFSSRWFERADGCYTHFGILSPKTSDSYFVDMMYVEFMKNFLLADSKSWWLLHSFWHPEPKNKWLLLCRHDVRRVHEKFSSRWFERADGCYTHFSLLSPKTFDSFFLHIMYIEFMKNFLLDDLSEQMAVTLISASWFKNVWFLLSTHHVRRVHEKFSSRWFERADGC